MKPQSSRLCGTRSGLLLCLFALVCHVRTTGGTPVPAPLEESYGAWETTNGIAGAGSAEDSDGDGIPNGIEFVIGGDPSGPDSDSNNLLPTTTVDEQYVTFEFRRTDEAAAYNPLVEYGSTLTGWTEAEGGVDGVVIAEDNGFFGMGIDRVRVQIPRALAIGSKLFARLRVEIP